MFLSNARRVKTQDGFHQILPCTLVCFIHETDGFLINLSYISLKFPLFYRHLDVFALNGSGLPVILNGVKDLIKYVVVLDEIPRHDIEVLRKLLSKMVIQQY
jgi:hypothetical protein